MRPRNLCRYRLHKLLVVFGCKFRHIFKVADGISRKMRICDFYIFGEIIDKLITPCFVLVDYASYMIIKQSQFLIDL